MQKIVLAVYEFLNRHKWLVWTTLASVIILCILSSLSLNYEEDIYEFLPETEDTERYTFVTDHYRIANEIVINISMKDSTANPDTELLQSVVDELQDSLDNDAISNCIKKITSCINSVDISSISTATASLLPYYLDSADYVSILRKLTPKSIKEQLAADRNMLGGAAGSVMKKVMMTDPLFLSSEKLKGLSGFKFSESYQLVDGYIFTKDGREAVVTIESAYPSSETKGNKALVTSLDRICHDIAARHDNITVSPFGAAYIAVSNAERIKKDSTVTIAAATVIILLILTLAYRNIKVILALGATLVFGMIFSMGVCGLVDDTVSMIAIGMGSIIIGIAANYPLHYLDHRFQGYDDRQTIRDICKPLTVGNATTVGAFLSLLFISSPAMHDLGLFASMILVGTILFVLIYLPHILKIDIPESSQEHVLMFSRLGKIHPEQNGLVILSVLIMTIIFSFTGEKTGFNADMNRINYMTPEQTERMAGLTAQQNSSNEVLYVFSDAETLDRALEAYEKASRILNNLQRDSLIESISGISGYLPSEKLQLQRIALWNTFWKEKGEEIADLVDRYAVEAGFREGVFSGFRSLVTSEAIPKDPSDFGAVKTILADNYIISTPDRCMILTPIQIRPENLRKVRDILKSELDSDSFCFSQGSMVGEIVDRLSEDFDFVLWVCGILVFIFLLFTFKSAELSIISFIPLAVSWIWITGIMGLFGLEFNIINIILATFIFGMGDDYTIFITEGCVEEFRTGRKILDTFKNTVMLSGIIIFAGIGVLVFAKHPALNQLGLVTVIGMLCVIIMAYIVPPFLFRFLTYKKGQKRAYPITLGSLGKTVFIFVFMMIATTYLALEGFILLTVMGNTKRHKKLYHRSIWRLSTFAVHHIPGTTFHLSSPFVRNRPSLIVANHQSHLDLMAILSISPDIVVLTNRWVQRFPFYAPLVRYADFLQVDGIAGGNTIAALGQLAADGYSIAIFPEGTRSEDGRIMRFHKGAFAISDALDLDVQPVILHGFSDTLPKADLLLRRGRLSMTFLDTIPASDIKSRVHSSTTGMLEIANGVRHLMESKLDFIRTNNETASYFSDRVTAMYLYKGGGLFRIVRKNIKDTNSFSDIVDALPQSGRVILHETSYGEMTLISGFARPKLEITSIVSDECMEILSNMPNIPGNITLSRH